MGKSKKMKELNERLLSNKVKAENKYKEKVKDHEDKRIVSVDVKENLTVKVDRGNMFVDGKEVRELVKDIFNTNVELKENSIINLDEVCDVCYRLSYKGKINNELLFMLC